MAYATARASLILLTLSIAARPVVPVQVRAPGVPAALSSEVHATLQFEPSSTLIGIPARVRIRVQNSSSSGTALPAALGLRVHSDGGDVALLTGNDESPWSVPLPEEQRGLAPGQAREFIFSSYYPMPGPPWFADRRLNTPSTLKVQAVFLDGPVSAAAIEQPTSGALISPPGRLAIEAPKGEDRVVWDEVMRVLTSWRGATEWSNLYWPNIRRQIADFALAHAPNSEYAAYLLEYGTVGAELRNVVTKLANTPDSRWRDRARLVMGRMSAAASVALVSRQHPAVADAIAAGHEARRLLTNLAENASDPEIQRAAHETLLSLYDDRGLREVAAEYERAAARP